MNDMLLRYVASFITHRFGLHRYVCLFVKMLIAYLEFEWLYVFICVANCSEAGFVEMVTLIMEKVRMLARSCGVDTVSLSNATANGYSISRNEVSFNPVRPRTEIWGHGHIFAHGSPAGRADAKSVRNEIMDWPKKTETDPRNKSERIIFFMEIPAPEVITWQENGCLLLGKKCLKTRGPAGNLGA